MGFPPFRPGRIGDMLAVVGDPITNGTDTRAPTARNVLVAGCSGGYGFRAARELAGRGHRVFAGLRDPDGSNASQRDRLAEFARTTGHNLRCLHLDVNDPATLEEAVATATADSALDAVVNTAAYAVMGPIEACRPEQLLRLLDTNVVGALRLFRSVMPALRAAGRGRIIQVTSGLGRAAVPFMGVYAATAWAQECLAEVLHYEAAFFGVEVGILEPAAYRSELGGPSVKPVGDEDRLAFYQQQLVAFGETLRSEAEDESIAGDPDEVARAIADAIAADVLPIRRPVGESARKLVEFRSARTTGEYRRDILERTGLDRFTDD